MALNTLLRVIGTGALVFLSGKEHERREQQKNRTTEMIFAAKAEASAAAKTAPPPTAGAATHTVSPSAIMHNLPTEPELEEFMCDLPQAVQNIADAMRMSAKLGNNSKIGLWQTAVVRVIALIQQNEFIYAMTWNAHCATAERHEKMKNFQESHGVVFFSNRRFLYYKDPANIIEFPLTDIYTVDAHKGNFFDGISFRTPNLDIQLSFAGEIDRKIFRDMVIYLAANAACPSNSLDMLEAGPASQICECPGCGATIIIHADIRNKCEYCGRPVESRQQNTSPTPTVAEELKKYNDLRQKGIISEEEFESIKSKLLSRV